MRQGLFVARDMGRPAGLWGTGLFFAILSIFVVCVMSPTVTGLFSTTRTASLLHCYCYLNITLNLDITLNLNALHCFAARQPESHDIRM